MPVLFPKTDNGENLKMAFFCQAIADIWTKIYFFSD